MVISNYYSTLSQIDIHAQEEAFVKSCQQSHLEVAQWLWNISNKSINIHAQDNVLYNCHRDLYFNEEMQIWLDKISKKLYDL